MPATTQGIPRETTTNSGMEMEVIRVRRVRLRNANVLELPDLTNELDEPSPDSDQVIQTVDLTSRKGD
jgi:hypothetical protein